MPYILQIVVIHRDDLGIESQKYSTTLTGDPKDLDKAYARVTHMDDFTYEEFIRIFDGYDEWRRLQRKIVSCKGVYHPSTSDEIDYPLIHDDCPIQDFCRRIHRDGENLEKRIERLLELNSVEKQNVTDRDILIKDVRDWFKETHDCQNNCMLSMSDYGYDICKFTQCAWYKLFMLLKEETK